MGLVYASVQLTNRVDFDIAQRFMIGEEEIRRMHVNMQVDSGIFMMCINEHIKESLGLTLLEARRPISLADGKRVFLEVAAPIEVRFAGRIAICNAFVLPGDSEPILGAIPMGELDVLIHPQRQELVVNPEHPEGAVGKLPGIRPASHQNRNWLQ